MLQIPLIFNELDLIRVETPIGYSLGGCRCTLETMTSFVNTVFAGNPSQYIIESKYWPDLMICKLATECGLDRPGET